MSDRKRRSIAKAVTWRIAGIIILGVITYFVTGSWEKTGIISITFHSIRLVLYYFHERAWEKIKWGRKLQPEYSI